MDFTTIKVNFLEKIVKWLVGGEAYKEIKGVVDSLMDANLTGEQKRELAIKKIKTVLVYLSDVFINLAIETAVVVLKHQMNKLKEKQNG